MTQFLSITDKGGNIGRIRWSNSYSVVRYCVDVQDESPVTRVRVPRWGMVTWDQWWPLEWDPWLGCPGASPGKLAARYAKIANNAAMAAQALLPSVQQATEAIREFRRTMERQQK